MTAHGQRALVKLIAALLCATTLLAEPVPPEMQFTPLPTRGPQPADDPAQIALGRLLFFDPILSATKTVACATCHDPAHGWTDARPVPIGTGLARLTRNAPTLLNVAFNGLVTGAKLDPRAAPMFWDNRASGLEAQAVIPIRSREEMRGDVCAEADALPQAVARVNAIPAYRQQFRAVFGEDATAQNLPRALAAFERSLVTEESPFDRYLRGDPSALNAEQQRGLKVFQDAGCQHCHGGPMFSDYKPHFIGLPDRIALRTPTLRQLRHTAPYMHDGSVRTIRDALIFYEALSDAVSETLDGGDTAAHPPLDPLLRHLDLRADDFTALEAFLDTLSTDYDRSAPQSVPSGLPVGGR